jgi:hypothetical protein
MSLGVAEKLKVSPKIKSITVNDDRHIVLKWSKVPLAEKYAVKRATEAGGEFEHITWVKKCEFIDETALENTTYWYKITAWKKLEGKKTSTKTSGVKAAVISDITAPENIRVTSKDKKVAIELKWKNPPGTDGCYIGRRNDFFSQIIPVAKVQGESFIDEGIVSGQPYHYSLQCFKNGEECELHGNFSQECHCIHLDSGRILEAKSGVGKKVRLLLRLVAGADGYIIERSDSKDGEYKEVGRTSSGLTLSFEDKAPKTFKTYYYRCKAFKSVKDQIFESGASSVKAVKVKL